MRTLTRVAVLGAVLCGLFLMHGATGAASGGCHDPGPAMPGMPAVHAATTSHAAAGSAEGSTDHRAGALCVATPVRPDAGSTTVAFVVLGAASALWTVPPVGGGRSRRRAPPGGRALLARVCVSRT
jgi:hypothetical protein